MKARLPALFALALWLAVPVSPGQPRPTVADDPKPAVLHADDARLRAMLAADTGALDDLLTADCVYVHSYGGAQTKAELRTALKSGQIIYRALRYTAPPQVRLYGGETAVLTGTLQLEVATRDGKVLKPALLITAVYVLQSGRWRLASYQSTTAAK